MRSERMATEAEGDFNKLRGYQYSELFAYSGQCIIVLDPSFWQAFGITAMFTSQSYAHRFYDLILEGKDTTEFWEEILGA